MASSCRTRSIAKPNTLDYWFQVQSNGQIVSATYTGVVPDTFKSDSEVVLKGMLSTRGLHRAAQRRDGEVPVEVRSQAGERDALRDVLRRPPWPHSARSSCCSPSSPRPTRSRPSVAGARRRNSRLIESGIGAFYTVAAIMTVASGVIIYAFVAGDYSIRYVQRYSDSVQPLFYKITSYWGGLDGSVMFWVFLLSLFGSVAVKVNRERHRELIPYVVAVIAAVEMFFLFLMVIHNNPFATYLTESPTDGRGLNPLLQNFYMAIHPPTMYLGFVGLTIPFAFGMAALFTGHLDDSWLRAVRRWTMFSWFFLSLGLTLGMIWAYEELGWGGYWGWDPVENAGMLPWFTATAFLHSVMVQERRGMLRVWNVTLVIITFLLTIVGTFLTRSGVVQSIHAFGEDPELARYFVVFMIVDGRVLLRLGDLPPAAAEGAPRARFVGVEGSGVPRQQLDAAVLGAVHPVCDAVPDDHRSDQRRAAHGRAAVLQSLDGADRPDAAAADRRRSAAGVAQVDDRRICGEQFLWPVLSGLVAGGVLVALGVRVWSSGICFALAGFVTGTLTQEFDPRRQRATRHDRHRYSDRDDRPGLAQQAALRRLHRARRHRADLPRLCRRRVQPRSADAAEAGRGSDGRRLHDSSRRAARHRRRPEADDHRAHHGQEISTAK